MYFANENFICRMTRAIDLRHKRWRLVNICLASQNIFYPPAAIKFARLISQ